MNSLLQLAKKSFQAHQAICFGAQINDSAKIRHFRILPAASPLERWIKDKQKERYRSHELLNLMFRQVCNNKGL
jgi:hypothetical protein